MPQLASAMRFHSLGIVISEGSEQVLGPRELWSFRVSSTREAREIASIEEAVDKGFLWRKGLARNFAAVCTASPCGMGGHAGTSFTATGVGDMGRNFVSEGSAMVGAVLILLIAPCSVHHATEISDRVVESDRRALCAGFKVEVKPVAGVVWVGENEGNTAGTGRLTGEETEDASRVEVGREREVLSRESRLWLLHGLGHIAS